jgi:hypothetical protein
LIKLIDDKNLSKFKPINLVYKYDIIEKMNLLKNKKLQKSVINSW